MNYTADIAVIGGGASGLVAAITAKRRCPFAKVYIFEGLDRVGKKLITTGNGRCNITNRVLSTERYHGNDVSFAENILEKINSSYVEDFFLSIGVPFVNEGNKVFPSSFQASSVVDCLRFECDRLGVKTVCGCKITKIKTNNGFRLFSDNDVIDARSVICCTGLYSGGDKLGSDGSFYRLLKDLGYKTEKISPSIVQLKTETEFVRQLKGIKTDALVTLQKNGKTIKSEFGEVLFCDYGLSGPAIMNISREVSRSDADFTVSLDLYPKTDKSVLLKLVEKRIKTLCHRNLDEFFTGMLNKRLGQVLLKYCGFRVGDSTLSLSQDDAEKIVLALKDFRFKVTGNTGFINSQVSAGGISTSEFDRNTLMSRRHTGLFACGELLDIDGDCGGFNLAWAWSSGILAANSAVDYIGVKQ